MRKFLRTVSYPIITPQDRGEAGQHVPHLFREIQGWGRNLRLTDEQGRRVEALTERHLVLWTHLPLTAAD